MLISLHSCVDSTHTNCPVATREIFNFRHKETADPIIFVTHVLRVSNIYVDVSFHNTIKFFKSITLHIKLKTPSCRAGLQTSISIVDEIKENHMPYSFSIIFPPTTTTRSSGSKWTEITTAMMNTVVDNGKPWCGQGRGRPDVVMEKILCRLRGAANKEAMTKGWRHR
jgi:hypothetical protein